MIAVLADTHMPRGVRRLPERCVELITAAEAVIHAGDFFAASALEEVEALCPVVHAVHGNVDEELLRRRLPAELEIEIEGRTVAIIHDAGPAKGRLARLRSSALDGSTRGHGGRAGLRAHLALGVTPTTRLIQGLPGRLVRERLTRPAFTPS